MMCRPQEVRYSSLPRRGERWRDSFDKRSWFVEEEAMENRTNDNARPSTNGTVLSLFLDHTISIDLAAMAGKHLNLGNLSRREREALHTGCGRGGIGTGSWQRRY
jgi:hypothetical protein